VEILASYTNRRQLPVTTDSYILVIIHTIMAPPRLDIIVKLSFLEIALLSKTNNQKRGPGGNIRAVYILILYLLMVQQPVY